MEIAIKLGLLASDRTTWTIVEGGRLLVAVLESGGRRLLAAVVRHEGVEAIDRHFLRGHHHLADRRGACRGGPESTPPRTVAAVASGVERWGGRRLERKEEASDAFVPVSPGFFRLCGFSSSQWAILARGNLRPPISENNKSNRLDSVVNLVHLTSVFFSIFLIY
jgi:hypothetical protein